MRSLNQKNDVGILTGGQSKRMGQNKALLPFGGNTIIEFLIQNLSHPETEILLSANTTEYDFLGRPVIPDNFPDCGPIAGIEALLNTTKQDYMSIISCDTPFFNFCILELMLNEFDGRPLVLKSPDYIIFPTLGIYPKTFQSILHNHIIHEKYSIYRILQQMDVKYYVPEISAEDTEKLFLNMNFPAEYTKALNYL